MVRPAGADGWRAGLYDGRKYAPGTRRVGLPAGERSGFAELKERQPDQGALRQKLEHLRRNRSIPRTFSFGEFSGVVAKMIYWVSRVAKCTDAS